MLREDLEIALMPAGCAIAFPKRYERHNKVLENEHNSDITLGIDALQACSSGWDVALNGLPKSKVSTEPESLPSLRCRKRNKRPSLVLENGDEDPYKKKKYDDSVTSVEFNQDSRVFRNSGMKKIKKNKLAKHDEMGDFIMGTAREKGTLKRKAEKCSPHEELMDKADVQNDDKKVNSPSKKRRLRRSRKNKEKKSRKERSLEDELMSELKNFHIGSNPNVLSEALPAAPKNLKRKHTDVNKNTFNLKKLVKWTKRRWNKDQKGATLASSLDSSVEVHNMPAIMSSVFQELLFKVFEKYGQITRIGPAKIHHSTESDCTFSTTIYFEMESAAIKALQEDHTLFGGSEIRVLRPPTAGCCNDVPVNYHQFCVPEPECRGSTATQTIVEQGGPPATQCAGAVSELPAIAEVNCEPSPVSKLRKRNITAGKP